MMLPRRTMLAGMAAGIAAPALAGPLTSGSAAGDAAGVALDAAAAMPPAEALRRLAGIDAANVPPRRRLDLLTARAGLAIDAALAATPDDPALRLQRTLGTVTPAAAEARIDRALVALLARAEHDFAQIGLTRGSVGDRYVTLFADARYHYPDSEAGRDAAVAAMNATLAPMRRATIRHLDAPAFAYDAAARRLAPAEIAAGKGGYRDVPGPGRPGAYIVDLKDITRRPRWSLPSVVAHELLPGHMIQLGAEAAAPPHPLRLTYAAAFVEGWGIHAETLAADWGLFTDQRDRLGHYHWLIFRAARGLVDLNIHHHGWTPDRARAALADWQGVPAYFAPFDTDLARIVREPGLRAAEAMAWLSIADHMPRAPTARRAFHHMLLADGRRRIEDLP